VGRGWFSSARIAFLSASSRSIADRYCDSSPEEGNVTGNKYDGGRRFV